MFCACAPFCIFTVTVDKRMSLLIIIEAICVDDSFICHINGIVHYLDIVNKVFADALCFSCSLNASKLSVCLNISEVTYRILFVRSDNI